MKSLSPFFLFLLCVVISSLYGRDHAYGPWNIDLSGGLFLSSNSNVFYEDRDIKSDLLFNVRPEVKFEYEQLDNVLFETELALNSLVYTSEKDANITETSFHMQAKPVHHGGYLIFSEDYDLSQSYSPSDGLLKSGVNILAVGGGYGGNHLDISLTGELRRGLFSPSDYSFLNYTQQSFEGKYKYRINSLSWSVNLGSGSINYDKDLLNDGRFWNLGGGIEKEFSPKSKIEFSTEYLSQNHSGSDGDYFGGLLFRLRGDHKTSSGKGLVSVLLEKEIIPSMSIDSDYVQIYHLALESKIEFNHLFTLGFDLNFEFDKIASRNDRVFELGMEGSYKAAKWFTVDFGMRRNSRNSDISEYGFNQFLVFIGVVAVY